MRIHFTDTNGIRGVAWFRRRARRARGAPFDATRLRDAVALDGVGARHPESLPTAPERTHTQVQNVVKILGLRFGTKYTAENIKTLRYGHLMIMTDQDHDGYASRRGPFRACGRRTAWRRHRRARLREEVAGLSFLILRPLPPHSKAPPPRRSHIKGPLINCLHHFWPSLFEIPGLPAVLHHAHRQGDAPIRRRRPAKTFFTVPLRRPSTSRRSPRPPPHVQRGPRVRWEGLHWDAPRRIVTREY